MTTHSNDGLLYLQDYPKLRQWINQCVACQQVGYKPELPDSIGVGVAARNLRRYFRPLFLNEIGLCEQCSNAMNLPALKVEHE